MGRVQGFGFQSAVYKINQGRGLYSVVYNYTKGVTIELQSKEEKKTARKFRVGSDLEGDNKFFFNNWKILLAFLIGKSYKNYMNSVLSPLIRLTVFY